jgi:ectoine hydroxylase-related dioxygenase (phytanoyl-CoA dioxygenase family)
MLSRGVVNVNLSDATTGDALRRQVERNGFAVVPVCLDEGIVEHLCKQFEETQYPQRNLLSIPSIRHLATTKRVREVIEAVLGSKCFAVRGIFFNKTQTANWKVVWHQDLTISVRERRDINGFGSWTIKDGVLHVQPPADVMSGMLAIRLHLDESGPDNGPLRVIAGSHKQGRLSAVQVVSLTKETAVTCCVPKGGALLMRPMLLHASSACVIPKPRRVIHLEFAATELPQDLEWHEKL